MAEPPASSVPLAEAVTEFLQWLELDRRASLTTVAAYPGELSRFQAVCARCGRGSPPVTALDRDLLRAFQRAVAPVQHQSARPLRYSPISPLPSEMSLPSWDKSSPRRSLV
jgi:site-specific recombinase XerC